MKIQRRAEHTPMPWANGRGTSYEIASNRNSEGLWTWRLAMAPVNEDGPFSRIECVNRSLVVVEGVGMNLSVDRKKVQCEPLQVVQFRGEAITEASLIDGPILDINLMVRRNDATGTMQIIDHAEQTLEASIVVATSGSAMVICDGAEVNLDQYDALIECDAHKISLKSGTVCAVNVGSR